MDHMMEDYNLNHLYTGKVILQRVPAQRDILG